MNVTISSLYEKQQELLEMIRIIEDRIENVNNKINNTTNGKQLDVLIDSKKELHIRLENMIEELKKIEQRIIDIEQYGEINPFDFSDIEQDDINLGEFLNIAESNIFRFESSDVHTVFEIIRDDYPFIIESDLKINDSGRSKSDAFFKNRDELSTRIDKINAKYDESIPITFTGVLIRYTKNFNKIRRSYFGTGCDSFKKIVEYKGVLCYIPEENECFRKCLKFIHEKDFSEQYHDFIKDSKRTKNIMTSAKIQTFCKKYNINLGVYNINQQEILPDLLLNEECVYIFMKIISVWFRKRKILLSPTL